MASKILYTNYKDKIGVLVSLSYSIIVNFRKIKKNKKRKIDKGSNKTCEPNRHVGVESDKFLL